MFRVAIGIILALFIVCFILIVVEELFLAGKRRRKLEKAVRMAKLPDTHQNSRVL